MTTTQPQPAAASSMVDGRSVAELLTQADIDARDLLWDPNPFRAKALSRTWGDVISSAATAWNTIPDPTGDLTMTRIQEAAAGIGRAHRRALWKGPGEPDPTMESIADALDHVTALVTSRHDPAVPLTDAGQRDADAARTRIMHIVYLASHAASLAASRYTHPDQESFDVRRRLTAEAATRLSDDVADRIGHVERLAGT